ncbi:MAG: DUF3108 domain-containing protein [Deltaproteobacteria bacterium]|nr:DUF3108 domain-containing protein [Deltaproteobacteria bacterium]
MRFLHSLALALSLVPAMLHAEPNVQSQPPKPRAQPQLRAALSPQARARIAPRVATKNEGKSCPGLTLNAAAPPFRSGEELGYDLTVAGLYVGRMEIKVGRPREVDGRPALTLFGRARTSGFTSTLKSFSGRYMVLIDPRTFRPFVLRTESSYDGDPRLEQTRFNDQKTGFSAQYKQQGRNGERRYQRSLPLYDLLTLLYYARLLPLRSGLEVCQEVYADKRLWRMDARVTGFEEIATPQGDKRALVVKTVWDRIPHPDFDPSRPAPHVEVDIYFADDATRAPLMFEARAKEASAKGQLVRWVTEDGEGESSWEF